MTPDEGGVIGILNEYAFKASAKIDQRSQSPVRQYLQGSTNMIMNKLVLME